MAIRIAPDAKLVRDSRLTLIRIITTLYDQLVDGDNGLKAKVKAAMQAKGAQFAESDLVIAALRAGSAKSSIDPRKLYKLVESRKLTIAQFLECVSVRKDPLKAYLSGDEIDRITTTGQAPDPALFHELRPGVVLDLEALQAALLAAVQTAPTAGPITAE